MKITEFIDKIKTPAFKEQGDFFDLSVIHFVFEREKVKQKSLLPLLFFSFFTKKFRELLKSKSSIFSETIDLASSYSQENFVLKSKLETSFLGQKNLYILSGFQELKQKDSTSLVAYLENYTGPNYVVFFTDDSVNLDNLGNLGLNKSKLVVKIENFVDKKTFISLAEFFLGLEGLAGAGSFAKIVDDIFTKNLELCLDDACVIINHAYLAGSSYKEFSDSWLNKIVTPQKSLFILSQYFFDRNPKIFLRLWQNVKNDFPEQFWISFWAEQVWRACNFVKLTRERRLDEAKKVAYRLPFSFMQRSWRNFTVSELSNAHNFLYSIDYSIKNCGEPFSIDLFYSKFLSSEFK